MKNYCELRHKKVIREKNDDDIDDEPSEYYSGKILYLGKGLIAHTFKDDYISIWNTQTAKFVKEFECAVNSMYHTSDNKLVISSVRQPYRVEIWDLETFKSVSMLNNTEILHYAQLKEGLLAHTERGASNGLNIIRHSITILSYDDKIVKEVGRFQQAHDYEINCLAALSDTLLASGARDWDIRIWDLKKMKLRKILRGHDDVVNDLKLISDKRLLSSSDDKTFRVWDVDKERCVMKINVGSVARTLLVLPSGLLAAFVMKDDDYIQKIKFYDTKTLKCFSEIEAHELHIFLKSFHYVENNCFLYWSGKYLRVFDFKGANRDQFASLENY